VPPNKRLTETGTEPFGSLKVSDDRIAMNEEGTGMKAILALVLLALIVGTVAGADPPAKWKLPEAEGQKWVTRVKAVARDGWSVELRGNEITIQRSKPVAMVRVFANPAPGDKPIPDGERTIKFVLRFAAKMSMDEYERLAAVNAASEKEYDRLHRAVGLPHKFDDFIATTPEQKKRVEEFRAAVAKLLRNTLPDLYTPDHSVYLLHSKDGWSSPADEAVAAECGDVEETLLRYFGMYNPAAAARRQGVGQYLAQPGR